MKQTDIDNKISPDSKILEILSRKSKSFAEYVEIVDLFGESREWDNSDPNEVLVSIMIELGELSEHFQWQKTFKKYNERERKEIAFELVDVFVYLFRIASSVGIDIEGAFEQKIPKLLQKFAIGRDYKEVKEFYRKTGKNKLYE